MIFVNYGGGRYWFFRHAPWNGLTVADLVFPWFMWIMGASMVFSLRSQIRRSVPKCQIWVRLVRRAALLFLLGLVVNSGSAQSGWSAGGLRVPGVLQRFAVCSLVIGTLQLPALSAAEPLTQGWRLAWLRDVTCCWAQWLAVALLAAAHTAITLLLPVPGCPRGYLGPGGLADGGRFANCTGGAAGYIDRRLFGSHMYHRPTAHRVYDTQLAYDPEGLLGTLTSCVAVFLGSVAGRLMATCSGAPERLARLAGWALLLCGAGGALCRFSQEGGPIPVNKNLWSLSFVLALSGLASALLAALHLLVDVLAVWRGRPFHYAGLNAIVLYLGHELVGGLFPVSLRSVLPPAGTHAAALLNSLWAALVWLLVAWRLYKHGLFIAL
ncbi:heparan-alpha-glucosaminide N-acetyltransferase-like [Amphibalanus amphitrite]|nr:heparan-alpha-glucosaminide N-acetyltransferase-like [Amphibalanus amphitrite]